jgi:hypothetical protein
MELATHTPASRDAKATANTPNGVTEFILTVANASQLSVGRAA